MDHTNRTLCQFRNFCTLTSQIDIFVENLNFGNLNNCQSDPIGFLKTWNDETQPFRYASALAAWEYNTNITAANAEADKEAGRNSAAWSEKIGLCAIEYFGNLVTTCTQDINGVQAQLQK